MPHDSKQMGFCFVRDWPALKGVGNVRHLLTRHTLIRGTCKLYKRPRFKLKTCQQPVDRIGKIDRIPFTLMATKSLTCR